MARKNTYNPKVHPTENNMPMSPQSARLYGKLNIGVKKEYIEPEIEYLILDGNSDFEGEIYEGSL